MKKKITILMLILAVLCSSAVPAVMADEKTNAAQEVKAEVKTESVKSEAKTELTDEYADPEKNTAAETELAQPTVNPNAEDIAAAETTSKPEEAPKATESPFEMFKRNSAVTGAVNKINPTAPQATLGTSLKPERSSEPEESARPEASSKPGSTIKPSGTVQPGSTLEPGSTVQPTASVEPSESPIPSSTPSATSTPSPTANPELTETQTKSVTGTVKSITDKKISINVSDGVTEEYIYGAPIKDIKTGDSVMITYDPKVEYMERIYEASDEFIENVKFVDFTVSKLNSMDLSDSITNGDLCGLIYNMLVYNEKIIDTVKAGTVTTAASSAKSITEAVEKYTEKHPEAKDTIKVIATGAPSDKKNISAEKNNLNALKAQALCNMGYVKEETVKNIEEKISREDAAVILATVYTKTVTSGNTSSSKAESYSDEKNISSDAKSSVLALQNAGIMTGDGKSFNPQDEYTEEDAITDILKIEKLF